MNKAIGKITATEKSPTTTTKLAFWIKEGIQVRPFDIVRVKHLGSKSSSRAYSYSYAIVEDLHYITDSDGHLANYVSSDFGDVSASPLNERLGTTLAFAEVLYNDEDVEMPVRDGASVEWADEQGILMALGIADLRRPVPAGFIRMSEGTEIPIPVEADYLIGPEGAHLNIAGISGLATKTSYAMFLLNSLQQLQSSYSANLSMIVFNVKGRDLLHLHEPLAEDDLPNGVTIDQVREDWARCGLIAKPFEQVHYLYPYDKERQYYTSSHADKDALQRQIDEGIAFNYCYDVERGRRKLGLLFADIEDKNSTIPSCLDTVLSMKASTWPALKSSVKDRTQAGKGTGESISVASWRRFSRLLEARTKDGIFTEGSPNPEKRIKSIENAVCDLRPGHVLVIDIEPLPPYLQALVVGDVLQTILAIKLGDDEYEIEVDDVDIGRVVIFADELNKFAPRAEGTGILTDKLQEVAARGRSLGMVLFGAEQFRSGVDEQILGNCSTNVFGRTSPVEVARGGDYRFMSNANKSIITGLPKGSLMLQHAIFRASLLKVSFPFPFYHQPKM